MPDQTTKILTKWMLFLILITPCQALSQLNADFSANKTEGCSPVSIDFQNQSSGNIQDYTWNFGNGNTSDSANPSANYLQPGTYDVTLTVSDGSSTDQITKNDYITVFENPDAKISASPTSGCLPHIVQFNDESNQGDAPIQSWIWDFGDGASSTNQSPQHTYQLQGAYNISLVVEDQNGCSDNVAKNNFIKVYPKPNADFNAPKRSGCDLPLEINFSNKSTGNGNLSYQWKFGDGTSSSAENPSHIYSQFGFYDVQLIVTDSVGCKDTILKNDFVKIQNFQGGMSVNKTHGCTQPQKDQFQFEDNSTPSALIRNWSFGDGKTSSQENPTHSYDNPGVYPVELVTGYTGCLDTLTDTIYVQQVEAGFEADTLFSCELPLTVNFQDQSQNAQSYLWDFGNGDTSKQQNPQNTYNSEDSFKVRQIVTNQYGCEDTSAPKFVYIDEPDARIYAKTNRGCVSSSFVLKDTTKSYDPVKERMWDFDDGTSSSDKSLSHQFPDTGHYNVTLAIQTQTGCKDTTSLFMMAGNPPFLDFAADTTAACGGEELKFTDTTDFADSNIWHFGGEITKLNDTTHEYEDTGWFHPYVVPHHNGCPGDTAFLNDSVYISPPIAKFSFTMACDSPYKKTLINESVDYHASFWDFDDGNTSTIDTPVHKFAQRGQYRIKLVVNNDSTGCRDSTYRDVPITDPVARFTISDSIGCPPLEAVNFDAGQSKDVQGNEFYWNFDNGNGWSQLDTSERQSLIHPPAQTFKEPDTYNVQLQVVDTQLCRDTMIRQVITYQHKTKINADPEGGCAPLDVEFANASLVDTPLISRTWDFGNGNDTSGTDTARNIYQDPGQYTAKLVTEDVRGCVDSGYKKVNLSDLNTFFGAQDYRICLSDSIQFVNGENDNHLEYFWDFGDGDTTIGKNPTHTFDSNGTYTITMVARDSVGCEDTSVRDEYIEVEGPIADFEINDTIVPCPPLVAKFTNKTKGSNLDYLWEFGDESGSVLENPQHTYVEAGEFNVQLVAENDFGCQDSAMQKIQLNGPRADYALEKDSGCKPLHYKFEVSNKQDVDKLVWDFGDGNTSKEDDVTHTYDKGGKYVPSLILTSIENGEEKCEYSLPLNDTIDVNILDARFQPNKEEYCIYDTIRIDYQSRGNIQNWTWDFEGRSNPADTILAPYQYDSSGQYRIMLTVTDDKGCQDSAILTLPVHPKPYVEATGGGFICEGQSVQLQATEDTSFRYQWMPARGIKQPEADNPLANPDSTTKYRVRIVDHNGCLDTSNQVKVNVQRKPRLKAFPDSTIVLGDSAQLRSITEVPVKGYTWSPTDSLRCTNCPNPIARPFEDRIYTVRVEDTAGCFVEEAKARIKVESRFKIAIPEAFSPNGDGVNEVIKVRGWGIKELLGFQIYNRWGELVYESQKLEEGWDGFYQGEPQNTGTYTYVVKARSYTGRIKQKKGMFNLVR